jgi:hypothetical protein
VEAGHFVTVGHGLAEDDLAQMSEHASLELHVEAPDLALARAKERLLDETLLANLERDARVGQRSATQTFAELTHLEERQATERELRRAEALSPEHLAHRQAADCLADLAAARDQVAARATAGLADASELADIDAQVKEQEDRLAVLDQALVSTAPERERHAQAQLLAQARKATERRAELEARLAQLDDRMLGLQSVQEERRMVEAELARDADVPAEDLARRQAEDELIALRHERAGVARAERGPGLEAVGRLAELDQKIAEAMDKLHLLTDRQQRLGPTEEVERQARREATIAQVRLAEEHRRADAAARLADIDAKLDHWVALRVADALRHAPAYLPPRPAQSTVGPERETALGHWAAQVTEIEHFRARWAVTDPLHPLGPAPRTGGPAEQEWADTAERLGLTAELAAYYGLDQSSRPPARTPEQAKRAAEEMARRGSEKARRRIEQHRLQVAARRSARAKEVDFSLVVA